MWVYDHFHNFPVPAHEAMFECWTTVAAISQRTSRIKLGQNLVGTPDQVADKVQAYVDLGCTGFYPWCSDYPDTESMRLFAPVADGLR